MRVTLTPSYYLTDELGDSPRLVQRQSGQDYGPDDIVQLYQSWDLEPARQSVRRAAAVAPLQARDLSLVSAFVGSGRPTSDPAIEHIHLRVSSARKAAYLRAAEPGKLSEWIFKHLDKAAEYTPLDYGGF